MSLHPFFAWCNETAIGVAVRESLWLFPTIEVVHLLALAVLGGAVLLVDLRLLGLGLRSASPAYLLDETRPWLQASILVIALSGIALFLSEALKCYENPAFWAKMAFFAVALLFTFAVRNRFVGRQHTLASTWAGRGVAVLSMSLWTSVGVAGRAIGFW